MAKYQREVLCLDFIVGFECPEYEGNRLEAKIKHKVTKVDNNKLRFPLTNTYSYFVYLYTAVLHVLFQPME